LSPSLSLFLSFSLSLPRPLEHQGDGSQGHRDSVDDVYVHMYVPECVYMHVIHLSFCMKRIGNIPHLKHKKTVCYVCDVHAYIYTYIQVCVCTTPKENHQCCMYGVFLCRAHTYIHTYVHTLCIDCLGSHLIEKCTSSM
jgi:hypothetical protein